MANVAIHIQNLDTDFSRDVKTDSSGLYRASALAVGRYSVEFTAPGFEQLRRQPIQIASASDTTLDAILTPGTTQQTVSVIGEAPLIETAESQIVKTEDERNILELPGSRSLTDLALLQPGVVNNQNGRPGSGFSVNGGRTRSNNFMIDGANNNDQSLSTPRLNLAPEYLGEFAIVTNSFAAEYGRNSGAEVNQITRSGSNEFHGIERYTWLGNGLNALSSGAKRNFNAFKAQGLDDYLALRKSRAVTVENIGVMDVGGPVKKNRAFFFVGYDVDRYRTTAVPTATTISAQGYANLQANASLFAPGTLSFLQKTFPVANSPASQGQINVAIGSTTIPVPLATLSPGLTAPLSYGTNYYRWIGKGDVKLSDKNTLSARYIIGDSADPGSPTALPNNAVGQNLRDQSMTLNDTHVFSATLLNEARATYSRRAIAFPENLPQYFSIGGLQSTGNINYPQGRVDNNYEYTDNVTFYHGHHNFKGGFNLYRAHLDSQFAAYLLGGVTYSSLSDFLLDRNAVFTKFSGDGGVNAVTYELGTFFQDDWKVNPNLTLNLGIRYEYTGAPYGYFSNAKPDINNFSPHVGFAWAPRGGIFGNGKTSIRGGFSMSYDQIFQNVLLNVGTNYPKGIRIQTAPTSGQALYLLQNQPQLPSPQQYVSANNVNPATLDYRYYALNKRIKQPYTEQWTLGIERQIAKDFVFKIYYIGTHGVGLIREQELNLGFNIQAINANPATYAGILPSLQPVRNAAGAITGYRRYPNQGSLGDGDALAQSHYHSMQTTLEKRYSNGLNFSINYTYSSFIDDADDILGGTTNSTLASNPMNLRGDKARSGLDQPQRFVANYVYSLPFFKEQRGFVGRALGGYEISGVTTFASGTPYSVINSANALGVIASGTLTALTSSQRVSVNPNGVKGTATSSGVTNPYFIYNDTNTGIIGNLGRNTQRTGGIDNTDVSLVKNVRLASERLHLQLRAEIFDVFNHRNFTTIPASTVTNNTNLTTFLNLGYTSVAGRVFNLAARISF